jgi:hypothetical protein
MEQLQEIGLYLNDLNRFDGSAEILVTELQHSDQLNFALNAVSFYPVFVAYFRHIFIYFLNSNELFLTNYKKLDSS